MNIFYKNKFLKIILISFFAFQANAGLIDRGQGMIYDTYLDITWLADANYARTSGYDLDGTMGWNESVAWADQLNYGGFDDWRLVNSNPADDNCSIESQDGIHTEYLGYGCIESELGHLFSVDMELDNNVPMNTNTLGLFQNIGSIYWTNTESKADSDVFIFLAYAGVQALDDINHNYSSWAVRDGDVVISVSEPQNIFLMLFALTCLILFRKRLAVYQANRVAGGRAKQDARAEGVSLRIMKRNPSITQ